MTTFENNVSAVEKKPDVLRWEKLPALPDREGFAGSFAGVHNDVLIVAGGANFPDKRPWEGGTKTWYHSIYILEKKNGQWRNGFVLPRPLGYGVSISCKQGVLCIGGSDARQHYSDVFSLSWVNDQVQPARWKSLPKPCANMCGALVGNTVYVAGGLEKPDSTNTLKTFWALDLADADAGWRELEPWLGPGRMLATAGAQDGAFYLCGGANLKPGPDNKPVREWLRDAYSFTPGKGWNRLADLPHAAVAAPSPAPALKSSLLIIGGDDGSQVSTPPTEHRGFPRGILSYDTAADKWTTLGEVPFSLVTTPAVDWGGTIIVPGGEAKPGVRSTEVWTGTVQQP